MVWGCKKTVFTFVFVSLTSLFSGCIPAKQQQEEQGAGMKCDVRRVSRDTLIRPTTHTPTLSKHGLVTANSFDNKSTHSRSLSPLEQHQRYEAQLSDIAIPVMAQPVDASGTTTGGAQLTYHCTLTRDELVNFYTQDMERLGWRQTIHSVGNEVLLSFKKPGRFCAASIRPTRKTWERSKKLLLMLSVGNG